MFFRPFVSFFNILFKIHPLTPHRIIIISINTTSTIKPTKNNNRDTHFLFLIFSPIKLAYVIFLSKLRTLLNLNRLINMKKLVLSLFLTTSFLSLNAQFRMNSHGQVEVGKVLNPTDLPADIVPDTLSRLKIIGPYGENGSWGRLSFGDQFSFYGSNVVLGEYGFEDTDQLLLHGKNGIYLTYGSEQAVASYDINSGDYFKFNTDVMAKGVMLASDSRFKENIKSLDYGTKDLSQITPVTYTLKAPTVKKERMAAGDNAKLVADQQRFEKFYSDPRRTSPRIGFIAQEVADVFPELVYTDSAGYEYVDYIGFIPLLVNVVNEQQQRIDELETELGMVKSNPQRLKTASIDGIEAIECKLFQNTPNPFSESTEIAFTLSETVNSAMIYIYDMQGLQKASYNVGGTTSGKVTIEASSLPAGMYLYSLIADGNVIDTKRMILTR